MELAENNAHEMFVGKKEVSFDDISPSLVKRIEKTFGEGGVHEGESLPYLWHWAFFQEPVEESELNADGHLSKGKLFPAVTGKNRMWAGGRVNFLEPIRVGLPARRSSTVLSVKKKRGKSGDLLFVTIEHVISQGETVCVREEQDIVYRSPGPPRLKVPHSIPELEWKESLNPSSIMLFRYSAVTFNSHRIHYDYPYATEQESYPGLVVQGPMIATLLLRSFTRRFPNRKPRYFSYRGLRPLIADVEFEVGGAEQDGQQCTLWAFNDNGPAHQADIYYQEGF